MSMNNKKETAPFTWPEKKGLSHSLIKKLLTQPLLNFGIGFFALSIML